MYLVDHEILNLAKKGYGIITEFDQSSLGSVSYDMHLDSAYHLDGREKMIEMNGKYKLCPFEPIMIKLKEKIKVPDNMIVQLEPRNYVIRLGLDVKAPIYQPGHETYCFIRVMNITNEPIMLCENFRLVQAFFHRLDACPDKLYGMDNHTKYQNERKYIPSK